MRLSPDNLRKSLELYDLPLSKVVTIAKGYRNTSHIVELENNKKINLIVYKSEPGIQERIQRINQFGLFFNNSSLPVRVPIDDRLSRFKINDKIFHMGIYNYLPGATIPWDMYSMKHIKLLGWALGDFHRHSRTFTVQLPNASSEYLDHIDVMSRYFDGQNVIAAMGSKLGIASNIQFDSLTHTVNELSILPNQQALHLDFVRGNILFDKSDKNYAYRLGDIAISGIIDLEKASWGHPVWDVARSMSFLLVDCPKPAEKINKYFIQSGYRKRAGQAIQLPLLREAVIMFLVYDFYKFLRDNPYESLSQNHHYRRTRDILAQENMLYLV